MTAKTGRPDVFISYAYEDKEVARPLAEALRQRGLAVWYDEYILQLGDSLREVIDHGLASARFGVVILSPVFFSKQWPQRELNALFARETANRSKVLLPVWHKLTLEEVAARTPLLADRLAVSTSKGIPFVVDEIVAVLESEAIRMADTVSLPPPAIWQEESSLKKPLTSGLLILQQYGESFRSLTATGLPSLIPTRLYTNNLAVDAVDFKSHLAPHRILHLCGPSGSGKSHFARHLVIDPTLAGYVPILAPGRYYDGNLAHLLDRSIAHITPASATSLLLAATENGSTGLLVVDGFNECPERYRGDLVKDLLALRLRHPVAIVITCRSEASCSDALQGSVFELRNLDHDGRERFIAYYGAPVRELVGILRTPLDIEIAADTVTRLRRGPSTQYDLFHAYVRGRLGPEPEPLFGLLVRLARHMATAITNAIPESAFHRLALSALASSAGAEATRALNDSSLLAFSHGYCSFHVEKIQRFFQAEALLLDFPRAADLVTQLKRPANADTLEFVIGAMTDNVSAQLCLTAISSQELLGSVLDGDVGELPKIALESALSEILRRACAELTNLSIEIKSVKYWSGRLIVKSEVVWRDHDYVLMATIGRAFSRGYFIEETICLFERTESEILKRLEGLAQPLAWEIVFPFLYVGASPQTLPAGRIFDALQMNRHYRWSQAAKSTLAVRLRDLGRQSPGMLVLLVYLLGDILWCEEKENSELLATLPTLLRRCWDSGVYHLRLEAVELAGRATRLEEPLWTEIKDLLESFLGENVVLNSAVFESLSGFIDLGLVSDASARSEIQSIIEGARSEEVCRRAAAVFDNQFEEVMQDHYCRAIEELGRPSRLDFLVKAALGMQPDSLFVSLVLHQLVEIASADALCVFERWAAPPQRESVFIDDVGGIFLLAHIGLALTAAEVPALYGQMSAGAEGDAWALWGEMIFWLHRPRVSEAAIREACAPLWARLKGAELLASIDPWYRMARSRRSDNARHEGVMLIAQWFASEARALLELALPQRSKLTSVIGSFAGTNDARAIFMIDMLGFIGNERSVCLLEALIDSRGLGKSAINAIMRIRERKTSVG
jgi:hypothetical protein